MRVQKLIVLVVLAALGVAACGSSSKSASGTTTTSAAPSGATGSTGAPTSAAPTTVKVSGSSNSHFCSLARADVAKSQVSAAVATDTPAELEKLYGDLLPELQQAEDIAPSQIKGDFGTFVTAYGKFLSALKTAKYNFEELPPTVGQDLETPAVKAATAHIEAYFTQVCGINTGTTPPT